jgi:putative nucleotidyltransferase with HDIG domain
MAEVAEKENLAILIEKRLEERPEVRPFPGAVTQLLAACQDPNATAATFEKIIQCDAALSVRLLRIVNSSLYGLANKVSSVGHATVILGMRQLKGLALSVGGSRMFAEGKTAPKERQELWNHSLGCATVARLLAKSGSSISPEDAFLGGILHDVGKLLLYDVVPDEYAQLVSVHTGTDLIAEERALFGMSHEEIGLKSAHAWDLPKEIKATIGFHHHPDEAPVHAQYAFILHLADTLARTWGIGTDGVEDPALSEEIIGRLGLNSERLAKLEERSRGIFDEASQTWAA